jgi:hypothetical protein
MTSASPTESQELARLARLSIGQAVGLVLSSGGARGFAIASLALDPRDADGGRCSKREGRRTEERPGIKTSRPKSPPTDRVVTEAANGIGNETAGAFVSGGCQSGHRSQPEQSYCNRKGVERL